MRTVTVMAAALLAVLAMAAGASAADYDDETTSKTNAASMAVETDDDKGSFYQAFIASFLMILVAEIGDRTFFIAAIMAMKHPRLLVFTAALSALIVMTILSVVLGYALPNLIPRVYTYYLSLVFFVFFGVRMLREWRTMSGDEAAEELAETEDELKNVETAPDAVLNDLEAGKADSLGKASMQSKFSRFVHALLPAVWIQTFVLTFLAEWGDRSQLTTIAMAAAQNPWGITIGGITGHALCTGVAVIGGRLLAQRISVRTVTLMGALLFLSFAIVGFLQGPEVDLRLS